MHVATHPITSTTGQASLQALRDPPWIRWGLTCIAVGFIVLFLCVPLGLVLFQAFAKGWQAYWQALTRPDAIAALRLTLIVALATVPLNTVFGVAAAWAITRFEFRGKSLLTTLIDLPFSVSPVISGLIFVSRRMARESYILSLMCRTST